DNVVDLDLALLEENYSAIDAPPCMLVPVRPVPGLDGDYVFYEDRLVTAISREQQSDIYCSGIQILNPARINQLTSRAESFYDLWAQLIDQKQLFVSSVYPKRW